jgi:penicillin-binding protein 1B
MAEQLTQRRQIKTQIIRMFTELPQQKGPLSRWQSFGLMFALPIFAVFLIGLIELVTAYHRYAALIDTHLAEQYLQQPAGIYAAPRRVSTGQRLTREELSERLLRAGYLTNASVSEFAAGNFALIQEGFEIRTNEYARTDALPARVIIKLNQNSITRIEDADSKQPLNAIDLPAELLTGDFNVNIETHRQSSFDEIPDVLVKALCATEDRRFFEHQGIDFSAIARAAFKNLRVGAIRQGGSTLTQQFVKNQFLSPERTWGRKYAEALMAIALERRMTKKQIFALYANRIYLGHSGLTNIYGFKQAARVFLGKELNSISLAEAAFLAGLVKAPNRFATPANAAGAQLRRDEVLTAMCATGIINTAQLAASKQEPLNLLAPQKLDGAAPYFVDYVKREYGQAEDNEATLARLRVETTLDLDLQQAAQQAVTQHLGRLNKLVARRKHAASPEVALVALDAKTGEIKAMIGGRDYATSQLNRVTDAQRQPGSVFKPIVYAAALARGLSPATTFKNEPHDIEFGVHAVYRPQNFRRSYSRQPVTMRDALVRSLNVVTVDAAMETGLGNIATLAERMGLPRPQSYPSLALGAFEATPLQVARAYTVFANNGMLVEPHALRTVRLGNEIMRSSAPEAAMVCPTTTAYLVTDALADVVNRGTASVIRKLGYRGPAAGKTGTSRDAWFAGYTPQLVVVIWVGYDDNTDLRLTGGEAAAPIWADFMKRALELRPDLAASQFTRPPGLELVEIDIETGTLANEYCPYRRKMLLTNSLMPGDCFQHHQPLFPLETEIQRLDAVLLQASEELLENNAEPTVRRPLQR